jgi:hypothetical protein
MRTRGCGCTGHPAFPRPSLLSRAEVSAQLGRVASRESGRVFSWLFEKLNLSRPKLWSPGFDLAIKYSINLVGRTEKRPRRTESRLAPVVGLDKARPSKGMTTADGRARRAHGKTRHTRASTAYPSNLTRNLAKQMDRRGSNPAMTSKIGHAAAARLTSASASEVRLSSVFRSSCSVSSSNRTASFRPSCCAHCFSVP